jgi:hypothetical protein
MLSSLDATEPTSQKEASLWPKRDLVMIHKTYYFN